MRIVTRKIKPDIERLLKQKQFQVSYWLSILLNEITK
jgi:hypothetical protein